MFFSNYKEKNLVINKDIRCKNDVNTYLYTLYVNPDNTYKVLIDNEEVGFGELEADWDFLPPKRINDSSQSKPEDWDDKPTIPNLFDTFKENVPNLLEMNSTNQDLQVACNLKPNQEGNYVHSPCKLYNWDKPEHILDPEATKSKYSSNGIDGE
ncbi:hypothetical protein M0802_012717 [Mischocyttarus mexicanus]|nr:hypothetical protein M0802_012717 [Mischocyttarus mexicanus]